MPMKLLITSGGTTETIDAVRGITNRSTGQLGKIIAETFLKHNHEVTLVTTKGAVKPTITENLTLHEVTNVDSLMTTLEQLVPKHDVLIHSMAVSDYTPVYMTDFETVVQTESLHSFLTQANTETKISSQSDYQVLFLKKTPKVISFVKKWNPDITLVGFKLLVDVSDDKLIAVARESLSKNKADYILANDLTEIKDGKHRALLVSDQDVLTVDTKEAIAQLLYERITTND
ncbi:phosphopantothenate--cysteine ligase [Streptococcus phocae]|uniref:Phosphopantothenate--cysteine ligase n=2 Tax=Streptococcus phocae TaxID=119224 RepID=A0A0P6SL35_9STRE|nr:phosphopantothenate--cysteine ligase [Streptococcus phocae]